MNDVIDDVFVSTVIAIWEAVVFIGCLSLLVLAYTNRIKQRTFFIWSIYVFFPINSMVISAMFILPIQIPLLILLLVIDFLIYKYALKEITKDEEKGVTAMLDKFRERERDLYNIATEEEKIIRQKEIEIQKKTISKWQIVLLVIIPSIIINLLYYMFKIYY